MLKKLLTVTTALAIFFAANSQDSTKGTTTFTTSVDAYYRYDFTGKYQAANNKNCFTNSANSFELGMASIKVDHSFGKLAATADLGFGRRAQEFSYNDLNIHMGKSLVDPTADSVLYSAPNSLAFVKQAYLSYQLTSKLKITAGKWATHVGWELVDAYANRNYSMAYAFNNGPFFHTGIKADISLGGKTALMVGAANPTDFSTSTSGNTMFIAQLTSATKDDKLKAYLNYQGGTNAALPSNKLSQFDLVLNYAPSSKFSAVYNGTIQNQDGQNWGSNVLYLNYDPTSLFGLTWRNELFDDAKGLKLGTASAAKIFATTLSANFRLSNLTIIPEVRFDSSDKEYSFLDKDGNGSKSAASFLVAVAYKF